MLTVTAKLDEKALAAYLKRLDRNRGKPLLYRAEKTTHAAVTRVLVPRIKANAPVGRGKALAGGFTRGGNLRRRTGAKLLRKRGGEDIRPTWAGSKAWYSRLVATGTAAHPLDPRPGKSAYAVFGTAVSRGNVGLLGRSFLTDVRPLVGMRHPGATAKPFVPDAVEGAIGQVVALVRRDVFDVR